MAVLKTGFFLVYCRPRGTENSGILWSKKIVGKTWYPLLYISTGTVSNAQYPPFTFLALPNGNMKYQVRVPENGRCTIREDTLAIQGYPGHYHATFTPSVIRFVRTDYCTYFISYITVDSSESFLAFAGSNPNVTPACKRKFREVATSLGISGDIMHNIQQETC